MFMDFKPKTIAQQQDYYSDAEKLIRAADKLTEKELQLLITINILTADRPDRRAFATSWQGKTEDLPALLAQI